MYTLSLPFTIISFFLIPSVHLDLDALQGMDSMLHKRILFQYSTKVNNTEIRVKKGSVINS